MAGQGDRAKSTRDAILDAAIDLFIEAGFETTPMDAIAEKAGVAKGTLYYHFKSKEGIVEAIIERFAAGAEAAFALVVQDASMTPLAKLEAMTAKMTERVNASFSKLHRMKYIDIHWRTQSAMVSRFAPFYARILEEGNEAGLWKAAYPLELARISLAASSFLFDPECSGLSREGLEATMVAEADLIAKGLGVEPEIIESTFAPFAEFLRKRLPGAAGS